MSPNCGVSLKAFGIHCVFCSLLLLKRGPGQSCKKSGRWRTSFSLHLLKGKWGPAAFRHATTQGQLGGVAPSDQHDNVRMLLKCWSVPGEPPAGNHWSPQRCERRSRPFHNDLENLRALPAMKSHCLEISYHRHYAKRYHWRGRAQTGRGSGFKFRCKNRLAGRP